MTPTLLLAALLLSPTPLLPLQRSDDTTPGFQRYIVDTRQSEVGFDGTSTLHDFVGRTRAVVGELHVDPARVSATAGGRLAVAGKTLDSDSEGRDEEMHETLEISRYPNIVLTVEALSGSLESWQGTPTARVTFDIHGITRGHTLPVTITPMGRDGFQVSGELELSIEDHDLEPPGFLFVSMDEQIKVWFDVALRPVKAEATPAQSLPMTWVELRQPLNGEPVSEEHGDLLWVHGEQLIWDRQAEGSWLQHTATGTHEIALRSATRCPSGPSAEGIFAKQRAPLTEPGENGQRLGPPTGEATITRELDSVEITLGGAVWARLSGLQGKAPFGALLGEVPGVPAAVRSALATVNGLPASFFLHTMTPVGSTRIQGHLGESAETTTPDWYWDPTSWTTQSSVKTFMATQR